MQRLPCRVLAVQTGGRLRISCSYRQHGGSQSSCSACLRRVASCRPVEPAEDLGAVRCGPVLSGRKFQSHPGVPPGRLIAPVGWPAHS